MNKLYWMRVQMPNGDSFTSESPVTIEQAKEAKKSLPTDATAELIEIQPVRIPV